SRRKREASGPRRSRRGRPRAARNYAETEKSSWGGQAVQEARDGEIRPEQGVQAAHPDEQDPQPQARPEGHGRRRGRRSGKAAQDAAVVLAYRGPRSEIRGSTSKQQRPRPERARE